MRVQRSIEIAAPPEKIWPFLVEPEKILQWCIPLLKFEYTSEQRSGIGTTFYYEEKVRGRLMKLGFTVTEWVENERLTFRMTSGTGIKGIEQRWIVGTVPSGSRFTFTENVKPPFGILDELIGLFERRHAEAIVDEIIAKLKSLVEA